MLNQNTVHSPTSECLLLALNFKSLQLHSTLQVHAQCQTCTTHCKVLSWHSSRTTLKGHTISSTLKVGHSIRPEESTTCTLPTWVQCVDSQINTQVPQK